VKKHLLIAICLLTNLLCFGQEAFMRFADLERDDHNDNVFRIGFYNVENLFDLEDDSLTRDESFTPEGSNRYTFGRYDKKKNGLGRTILALGGWQPVELMGLCEVESKWVMDGLINFSPLKNAGYEYIHEDSPDRRGIDVACLYQPDRFEPILYKYFRIKFPFDPDRKTRDMLYVKGVIPNGDTLHFFVNHWPSRWGGQFVSEPSRAYVASVLRQKVDSLQNRFDNPLIVITGDLNDEPDDLSLTESLGSKNSLENIQAGDLVNLMSPIKHKFGTHSFAGEWGVLDQFIVSENLLREGKTFTNYGHVGIFDAPWLLKENAAGNSVTNRTYQGPAYKGGYSDHLPIFLDLILMRNSSE
jgi:hypothetical protein